MVWETLSIAHLTPSLFDSNDLSEVMSEKACLINGMLDLISQIFLLHTRVGSEDFRLYSNILYTVDVHCPDS